jgi:hypothetical protein
MKLKCKQDHWPATKGILGIGGKPRTKIEGLTEGNTYDGSPISLVNGNTTAGLGSTSTTLHFLIYNDDSQWVDYQLNLFEPI